MVLLLCVLMAMLAGCAMAPVALSEPEVETLAVEPRVEESVVAEPVAVKKAAAVGAPQALALPIGVRVIFTDKFTDYAVDGDGDGLFEALVIDVEVDVFEAGDYNLGASLSVVDGGGVAHGIDGVQRWLFLEEGVQMVPMTFEGRYIKLSKQDGPYRLLDLWITHIKNPTPMQLRENVIDSREVPYTTAMYGYEQFQGP